MEIKVIVKPRSSKNEFYFDKEKMFMLPGSKKALKREKQTRN